MTTHEGEIEPIFDSEFDINARAREYGEYLNIQKDENESDDRFRERVAGVLRSKGQVIEAHEVYSGRRWDDPDQSPTGPLAGIIGATAQVMNGFEYSPNDPERQIGDDIASGIVATHRDRSGEAIANLFDTVGPEAGMGIIDALFREH